MLPGTISAMQPEQVIEALWNRIAARDWPAVGRLLAPDIRLDWPATGEVIVGADNFLAIQSEYPEGWSINVRSVLVQGQTVVSEVEVPHVEFGVFRAASFWTVVDGVITAGTEYWVTVGGEVPPGWRARYVLPR